MWELKAVQDVKVGPSQFGRLDLLPPDKGANSGTLIDFKDKSGKVIRSITLGKKHMKSSGGASPFGDTGGWPDGRFVSMKDSTSGAEKVSLVAEPFSNLEVKPESWLNKEFVKVEKLKSVSVTSTNATNDWKMYRETEGGEMKLADKKEGEELDSSKIWGINNALSSANFNDVLPPDVKPETVGLDKPTVVKLDTFDSFSYTVHIGKSTNDSDFPLRVTVSADLAKERTPGKDEKPEDKEKLDKEFKEKAEKLKQKLNQEKGYEKWTYLMSKWSIEALLKPKSEFLAAPKTNDTAKAEASASKPEAPLPAIPGVTTTTIPGITAPAPEIKLPSPAEPVKTPIPTGDSKTNVPAITVPPTPVVPVTTNKTAAAVIEAVKTNLPSAPVTAVTVSTNPVPAVQVKTENTNKAPATPPTPK